MTTTPTILSLDDDPTVLEMIGWFLAPHSYRLLSATDSLEALCLLHQETVDLVTQDIERPHIGGFEFYWRMKADKALRDIPILIYAGYEPRLSKCEVAGRPQPGLHIHDFGWGPEWVMYVEGFVNKASKLEILRQTVRQILDTRRNSPLTVEERALRHQHLWAQAGLRFAAFDAHQPHMATRSAPARRGRS